MPSGADDSITKTIYDAVRDGLGIKEEALEFGTERTTKKYVSMTPGEAFGESIETFKEFEKEYVKTKNINR